MKRSEARKILYEKQNGLCYYCGIKMIPKCRNAFNDATIDHVKPKAKGGLDIMSNFVCACRACNEAKADRHVGDFLIELRQRGREYA